MKKRFIMGSVDVSLEMDEKRIACEISVGSTGEKEAANIEKRIKAGYNSIILCSPERRTLEKAKTLVTERVKDPDKVLYFEPQELFLYLESQGLEAPMKEKAPTARPGRQVQQEVKLKLVVRDKEVFTGTRRTIEDREVFFGGNSYCLTDKPFRFLYSLARSRKLGQKCVKYDTLFDLTSGFTEMAISKHIRTTKERIPPLKAYIETLPKLGYSLNLPPGAIEIDGVLEDVESLLR